MDIHKINQWPNYFFSLLFSSLSNKKNNSVASPAAPLIVPKKKLPSSPAADLSQARKKLLEGLNDLSTILESFYSLYTCEIINKSTLCEHYQEQAIQLTALIKSQYLKEPHTLEIARELLQQSDMFRLFHTLQQLKDYREELPSGWYESIKLPIKHINEANQIYQRLKNEFSH